MDRGEVAQALWAAMRAIEAGAPVRDVLEELRDELKEMELENQKSEERPDGVT